MKQKFVFIKDEDTKKLKLQEFGDLEPEKLVFLCEENYDLEAFLKVWESNDDNQIIDFLRGRNIFPPKEVVRRIITKLREKFPSEEEIEILIDDTDFIEKKKAKEGKIEEDILEETEVSDDDDIDDILLDEDADSLDNVEDGLVNIKPDKI